MKGRHIAAIVLFTLSLLLIGGATVFLVFKKDISSDDSLVSKTDTSKTDTSIDESQKTKVILTGVSGGLGVVLLIIGIICVSVRPRKPYNLLKNQFYRNHHGLSPLYKKEDGRIDLDYVTT